ncbi:MAG: type II secretion system protein [Phycisphaeraceae bacterium]
MSNHQSASPPRAFTLVEMLVVISLIALLISMLLPSLGRSRYEARLSKCASNWRQWTIAAQAYDNDNAGYLPRFDIPQSIGLNVWGVGNGLLPSMRYYGVQPAMWFCPQTDQSNLPWWMAPYKVDPQLIQSEDGDALIAHAKSFWPGFSMTQVMWWVPRKASNGWLPHNDSLNPAASATQWPSRMSQPNLGQHPLISDLLGVHPADGPLEHVGGVKGGHSYIGGETETINAAFADGHVERRSRSQFKARITQHYGNFY